MKSHNCTYYYTENQHIIFEKLVRQPIIIVWGGGSLVIGILAFLYDSKGRKLLTDTELLKSFVTRARN